MTNIGAEEPYLGEGAMIRQPSIPLEARVLTRLQSLAGRTGKTVETILDGAVNAYGRQYMGSEHQEASRRLAGLVEGYKRHHGGSEDQEPLSVFGRFLREQPHYGVEVLERALTAYTWDRVDEYWENLEVDPEAWEQEQQERAIWDAVLRYALEENKKR